MIKIDNFLVVAFVTHNTQYELILSQYLLPSLEKFNIPHYIEVIENQGSWLKNVAKKPQVIFSAMEKYPSMNIISLDADAEILEFPTLFNTITEDFACHILDWDSWYQNNSHIKEILSGTLFIRNNDKMKELVTKWSELATNSFEWEQKCLSSVLKEMNIKIYELPLEYCYIKSLPDGKEPFIKIEHPVILHHQVSRQLKKLIK